MNQKLKSQARQKKEHYIKDLERQQQQFVQLQGPSQQSVNHQQQSCCFGLIKMRSSVKSRQQQTPGNLKQSQTSNTNQKQQQQNSQPLEEYQQNFNHNKFKSAIFYLNYSARQMRGMSVDIDSQVGRKLTVLKNKLKNLDKYPKAQNFYVESQASSPKSHQVLTLADRANTKSTYIHEELKTNAECQEIIDTENVIPRQVSKITTKTKQDSDMMTGIQKTEASMLSMIFQDVNRIKNIEDFNAPLSNIDKVLKSLLFQMRANLNEYDHPIYIIVKKFQDIILWNVNEKKNQLQRTSKINSMNQQPLYEVVDNPDIISDSRTQDRGTDNDQNLPKSIKLSTAKIKKNLRATYDRQTLQLLPPEIQFAQVVIAEVKKFICILYGALIRFYISVMRFEDLHEMREDLIEMLTSLTVRGDLSKLLVQLCRLVTNEEENLLCFKYKDLKDIKPSMIGINKLFTLDENSLLIELFEKQMQNQEDHQIEGDIGGSSFFCLEKSPSDPRLGNSEKSATQMFNPLIQREEDPDQQRSKSCALTVVLIKRITNDPSPQNHHFSSSQDPPKLIFNNKSNQHNDQKQIITRELLSERIQPKPYMLAIENIRKLRDCETPIDKMRCLTQTSKHIVNCIDAFWRDINLIDKNKLTLDADELLMIFIYVTLRSKINEFYAHLKLINEFSTDTLRQSKLGYYTSTMEVALSEVLNLDKNKLFGQYTDDFKISFKNAKGLIEENLKQSLHSEFPLQAEENFEFLDQYDIMKRQNEVSLKDNSKKRTSQGVDMEFQDALGGHYLSE